MVKGIIKVDGNNKPVTGLFEPSENSTIIVYNAEGGQFLASSFETIKSIAFFSLIEGKYFLKEGFSDVDIFRHTHLKNKGLYPYSFPQKYEAINHFDLFKDKQIISENNKYIGASELSYTFGIEFEAAIGCIPEDECFRNGLIPLRDGSISAPEYSTVVMQGNQGLNLLQQQLKSLRKYTAFNKDCSLHIHFGGFPVSPDYILNLNSLWSILEPIIKMHANTFIYNTGRYKSTGKDYCNRVNTYESFEELFRDMTGTNYLGSLTQPHPNDKTRTQKWHIDARYKSMNLINMICYKSPKTVEFRFLRPTFNFTKIYTWLLILTGILKFAEKITKQHGKGLGVREMQRYLSNRPNFDTLITISNQVFPKKVQKVLDPRIRELRVVSEMQDNIGDVAGSNTSFEDEIMTFDYMSH